MVPIHSRLLAVLRDRMAMGRQPYGLVHPAGLVWRGRGLLRWNGRAAVVTTYWNCDRCGVRIDARRELTELKHTDPDRPVNKEFQLCLKCYRDMWDFLNTKVSRSQQPYR